MMLPNHSATVGKDIPSPKGLDLRIGSKFTQSNSWVYLTYILLILYAGLIVFTFKDYGITYDEEWKSNYGEYIIQWYSSGFHDTRALSYWNFSDYGGFFNTVSGLAARVMPLDLFETDHLLIGIFGLLAVVFSYQLGKLLGGPFTGFLSALFLSLTPRFYGHAFNNPIDIPMAALSTLSVYLLIRLVSLLPSPPRRWVLATGVAIGLTLGVRVGAAILIGYIVLAFGLWLLFTYFSKPGQVRQLEDFKRVFIRVTTIFLGICLVAYLVMLVWWPAAQVSPIMHPARSLWRSMHFEYEFNVFFDGTYILNTQLPWYYLPKWFLIALPEFYWIALTAGAALALVSVFRIRSITGKLQDRSVIALIILVTSALFPIAFAILTTPVDYDEIRHFLFVIPPLAVLAAFCLTKIFENKQARIIKIILAITVLFSLFLTGFDMVRLHPHQYIYFNRIFGKGVAAASQRYDTDYWGNSLKEGVEWVVKNYRVPDPTQKVKVASCLYSLSTSYYLTDPRFEYIGSYDDGQVVRGKPDLFLASPRWGCDKKLPGTVLHTVTRLGAPLLYVIQVSNSTVSP